MLKTQITKFENEKLNSKIFDNTIFASITEVLFTPCSFCDIPISILKATVFLSMLTVILSSTFFFLKCQ